MNSRSISSNSTDFVEGHASGSDSDTEPDQYYQPISAVDDENDGGDHVEVNSDEENSSGFHHLPNGYCLNETENGISNLDVNDDIDSSEDEQQEDEERMRQASESAIRRAFSEDENRRNAPLPPENASRVMEVMRGVSLGGMTPDWVGQVPEDRWIDQLHRLRQPSSPRAST
ncbi:serine/threonine-protein kinase rio2 [Quillaja saponaria]|uniref:Serine/threonine-protein kinase rio2 n=1 Tax=Quillaja saponaria TaxID=32244 RepID=A0AAD7PRC9_QUISA|nr:serine/threonine-protein kinase rio2 [Quillaja saponaria]